MNEHDLRRKFLAWLKKQVPRVWWVKISGSPFQRPNVPDYLLCVDGRFVAVELKHPDGSTKPTPGQEHEMRKIDAAGGSTMVIRSEDEFGWIFDPDW